MKRLVAAVAAAACTACFVGGDSLTNTNEGHHCGPLDGSGAGANVPPTGSAALSFTLELEQSNESSYFVRDIVAPGAVSVESRCPQGGSVDTVMNYQGQEVNPPAGACCFMVRICSEGLCSQEQQICTRS